MGAACCGTSEPQTEFEYAGRKVVAPVEAVAYEPTLVTAPEDPRIQDLMEVLRRYQRVVPAGVAGHALTESSWNGSWTLGCRNTDWTNFLAFLGVPAPAFETASTAPDHHWYAVTRASFRMRHHIPAQEMDLRYEATLDSAWRPSPYARQTSSHWSEDDELKKGFNWRHRWLYFPVSMRCEWENKGGGEEAGHGQPQGAKRQVTSVTVMERHLVAPDIINFRVWVYPVGADAEDDSRFLVPRCGVTYVRVGDDLPPPIPPAPPPGGYLH